MNTSRYIVQSDIIIYSSGSLGIGKLDPNASLDVSGSSIITGSLIVTQGITGSLQGTASYAITASYYNGSVISSSYAATASFITASGVYGPYGSNSILSASYAGYSVTSSISDSTTLVKINTLNQTGYTISKGMVVRITGSNNASDTPRITTASCVNDNNSANTLGIAMQDITNGSQGYVITEGVLTGIDTSLYTSGQLIYLGATGSIVGTAPLAPSHSVRLGEVIRQQSNNGSIYVRIDNGYELDELHDVLITSASSGDLLIRSGSVWINNKQLTGSYGLTGSLTATSFTGSLQGTATTASYVLNAVSASYATNALSASYAPVTPTFPYTGSAIISGSLIITGSATATQGFSGSFSGSFFGNGAGLTGVTATADTTVLEAQVWFLT